MKLETLDHVENELLRFLHKMREVRDIEQENVMLRNKEGERAYEVSGTRKHGAMRRAAHDLKEALTLITQNRDL